MAVILILCPSLVLIITAPDITLAVRSLFDFTNDLLSFDAMARRGVKSSLMNMRDLASSPGAEKGCSVISSYKFYNDWPHSTELHFTNTMACVNVIWRQCDMMIISVLQINDIQFSLLFSPVRMVFSNEIPSQVLFQFFYHVHLAIMMVLSFLQCRLKQLNVFVLGIY